MSLATTRCFALQCRSAPSAETVTPYNVFDDVVLSADVYQEFPSLRLPVQPNKHILVGILHVCHRRDIRHVYQCEARFAVTSIYMCAARPLCPTRRRVGGRSLVRRIYRDVKRR